jgi:hypothetical protein
MTRTIEAGGIELTREEGMEEKKKGRENHWSSLRRRSAAGKSRADRKSPDESADSLFPDSATENADEEQVVQLWCPSWLCIIPGIGVYRPSGQGLLRNGD